MSKLRDTLVEYKILTKEDISNMTLQEMFDHKFEILRKREIGLRLVDEMEAEQSKLNYVLPYHNNLLFTSQSTYADTISSRDPNSN